MNLIEGLVAELAPNGVEIRTLGEVLKNFDSQRRPVTKGDRRAGTFPYYGANGIQDYVDDFIFEGTFLLMGEDGSVKQANGRPVLNWASGKIWVNNHAHILQSRTDRLDLRFAYFYLQTVDISAFVTGGSQPKLNQRNMNSIRIPVPPLEVQREIVRVLDMFTQLEAELDAELEARRAQFSHYLLDLTSPFTHDGSVKQGWTHARVGEVAEVNKGKTPIQKSRPGAYPLITTGEKRRSSHTFDFDGDAVCVPLISSKGHGVASLSRLYFQAGKFALGSILAAIVPDNRECLSAEFLYYYLSARKESLLVRLMRGGANVTLTIDSLKAVRIYFPSCNEQKVIVNALRRIGSLTDGGEASLQAELAARRKQYAHYRDRLMTFKELTA